MPWRVRVAAPRSDRPDRAVSRGASRRSRVRAQRHDRSQRGASLGAARSRRRGGDLRSGLRRGCAGGSRRDTRTRRHAANRGDARIRCAMPATSSTRSCRRSRREPSWSSSITSPRKRRSCCRSRRSWPSATLAVCRCWSTAPMRRARSPSTFPPRRRLVLGQPAQVGARAPVVRHSLGEARASGDAASSGRLLGLRPRVSRGVRTPRHMRSDQLSRRAGGDRAAARVGLRRGPRLHARPRDRESAAR